METRPAKQQELWSLVRTVGPAPGARERILERIETPKSRTRWLIPLGMAAMAAAVLLVVWSQLNSRPELRFETQQAAQIASSQILAASDTYQADERLVAGHELASGEVTVGPAGHLDVSLAQARVQVSGAAALTFAQSELKLRRGHVSIEGTLEVHGPSCTARIDGKCNVSVVESTLMVTVFAGSAEVVPPAAACRVVHKSETELAVDSAADGADDETTASRAVEPGVVDTPNAAATVPQSMRNQRRDGMDSLRRSNKRTATSPSALKRQMDDYERAMALRNSDPQAALAALRRFRRTWSRSPLDHEIDLAIFDTLVRLGRSDQAKRAARVFLRRYPRSPKAAEIRDSIHIDDAATGDNP